MSNINEILKNSRELVEIKRQLAEYERMEESSLSRIFSFKSKLRKAEESLTSQVEIRNKMYEDYEKAIQKAFKEGKKLHGNTTNAFKKHYEQQNRIVRQEERRLKGLRIMNRTIGNMATSTSIMTRDYANRRFMNSLKEFDKNVKTSSLHLGLSASRSEVLRTSFEGSYNIISRLGATSADLHQIQTKYADETGRATILSSRQLEYITAIARGTGLSSESAANLVANFELMGVSVLSAKDHIETVLYTAERVGINSSKIINSMNTNFKKLQTYNFRNGVYGMSQLAMQSERFKQDMISTLASMDKARGLEEVIRMSADLQVLGGNFAALSDPMQMLFEARNDPEAYALRLAKMTNGLVAMKKTSEGFSFELASPMARDILDNASKALGVSTEELTQQAFRQKELTEKRKEMLGLSLNKDQRRLLETISTFDSKSGQFTVTVGRDVVALSSLTETHLKSLEVQRRTLEDRAVAARDFDQIYKSTIEQFKSVLLPMMRGVNLVMGWVSDLVTKVTTFIDKGNPLVVGIAKFSGAVAMLSSILPMASKAVQGYGSFYKSAFSRGKGKNASGGKGMSIRKRSVDIKGGLGAGAGVGLAGAGIGAGVYMASQGIKGIADSMSNLSEEKANILKSITSSLAWLGSIGAIAAGAVMIFGKATLVASPGLLAFGGAIALAGVGIGAMSLGLANMIEVAAKNSDVLFTVATGIAAINLATASSAIGALGLGGLAGTLGLISASASKVSTVGTAFQNIGKVITASNDDFDKLSNLLDKLQNFDIKKGGAFSEISNAFKNPLKVEFSDKEVNLVSNITLNVDGKKFVEELNIVERVIVKQRDARFGKSSI